MKKCPACGQEYEDTNTLCPADGAVLRKTEDALVGQVLAGKYRIEEKIDEGGMGCVYRATHVLMEKVVAVKVLHPALAADDKIVARFTREAKAASRISHPHAIVVTDFGESEQGVVYLVMEYLRGRTLKDVVRDEGPLPLVRVGEIIRQVSGALDAAHEQNVVHRDLKSDNIMLEETAGGDWAKVLDFGIAKIQEETAGKPDDGLTAPNLIIGTPQYMSPEQCGQTSDIDRRSDIYSLGVILFEMLAGHVPFTGDSPTAIMMKHIQDAPPSILEERADLPAGVGRVVARALAKRPEDRFQRASELSEALALASSETPAEAAAVAVATDTERIVVPTAPNDVPRATVGDLDDEATVVSAGGLRPTTDELPPVVAPVPVSGFNPWSVALPAIAALTIIFAVFFAYQRYGASSEPAQPPLNADPNSQPAQTVTPPTGQAESNLVPASTPTPASGDPGGAPLTTADPGSFQTEPAASPTPASQEHQGHEGAGSANQNKSGDEEADEEEPKPTPEATPRQRPTPAPEGPTVKPAAPPAPRPNITPKPDAPPDTQLSSPSEDSAPVR
jgi:tRNA A-37 threonylcarbamoyl transferase component Bud32